MSIALRYNYDKRSRSSCWLSFLGHTQCTHWRCFLKTFLACIPRTCNFVRGQTYQLYIRRRLHCRSSDLIWFHRDKYGKVVVRGHPQIFRGCTECTSYCQAHFGKTRNRTVCTRMPQKRYRTTPPCSRGTHARLLTACICQRGIPCSSSLMRLPSCCLRSLLSIAVSPLIACCFLGLWRRQCWHR